MYDTEKTVSYIFLLYLEKLFCSSYIVVFVEQLCMDKYNKGCQDFL